ncbi:MAG TPA: hypothetical protein VMN57_15015 [Anaerolineales bacterium]|nr:hypothetical protein [Anaerolineales bacterium]
MERELLIVLILVVLLVVGINGLLVLALRRGKGSEHIRLWQQAARRAQKPWHNEDEQLEALSKIVKELKDPDEGN